MNEAEFRQRCKLTLARLELRPQVLSSVGTSSSRVGTVQVDLELEALALILPRLNIDADHDSSGINRTYHSPGRAD